MMTNFAMLAIASAALVFAAPTTSDDHAAPARDALVTADADVSRALELAGTNRPEIERFLARYDYDGGRAADADVEKRDAARWLVANMPGHGFARISLQTVDGTEVPFEATDHRNLEEAKAKLRELERERGPLEFRSAGLVSDLTAITAEQLIANHELAFRSRRHDPWAQQLDFRLFCEFVLPYRGSEEALDARWRGEATERIAPLLAGLREERNGEPTRDEVARAVRKAAKSWVKFRQLYYLHPTDQNWSEMLASREGRCEDETNMVVFAARAAGVVIADDFTPFWADRDNNHAWDVVLDAEGRGSAKLAHRPAKVYRRAFAKQPATIGAMRAAGEPVPPGFAASNVLDVTAQYVPVSELSLPFPSPPTSQRFGYLCVFNGGEWRPVAGALVSDGAARFSDVGTNVLYLPAWYSDRAVVPAGPPFVLTADGERRTLATVGQRGSLTLAMTQSEDATPGSSVVVPVKSDGAYEVLAWDSERGAWRTIASIEVSASASGTILDVPLDGLLWVRSANGERLERPFTVEAGRARRW